MIGFDERTNNKEKNNFGGDRSPMSETRRRLRRRGRAARNKSYRRTSFRTSKERL